MLVRFTKSSRKKKHADHAVCCDAKANTATGQGLDGTSSSKNQKERIALNASPMFGELLTNLNIIYIYTVVLVFLHHFNHPYPLFGRIDKVILDRRTQASRERTQASERESKKKKVHINQVHPFLVSSFHYSSSSLNENSHFPIHV